MKISNKWKRMAEIYKRFSQIKRAAKPSSEHLEVWDEYDSFRDFSDEAMVEAFEKESFGTKHSIVRSNGKINGYIEGKQWMDLTITEYWLPDLENRELLAFQLYQSFPHWFLIRILPERYHLSKIEADSLYEELS
jgi:hypothetical protein